MFSFFSNSKLKKLSEDSLTKQPEEVFDVLEKLGEGWDACVISDFPLNVSNVSVVYDLHIVLVFPNVKSTVYMSLFSSYGSVFKAIHKESGQVVAIKQVPVESDLQEIIKEISIMQQCDRWDDSIWGLTVLKNILIN